MPDVKKITVTVGGTINLGNYSNAKLEVTVEGELGLTETVKDAYTAVSAHAHRALALEIRSIVEAELSVEWLVKGQDAEAIRRHVQLFNGFSQMDMIDHAVAMELIEETVAKYAVVEEPEMPETITSIGVVSDLKEWKVYLASKEPPVMPEERTVEAAGDWEDDDASIDDDEPEFDGDDDDLDGDDFDDSEILPDENTNSDLDDDDDEHLLVLELTD